MSTVRVILAFVVVLAAGALVGSAVTQWQPGAGESTPDSVPVQLDFGNRVRVEVLNAGGRPNMAREAVDLLRTRGFDVVDYGNAESFGAETSVVLDRVGRVDQARAVADALGIGLVESQVDENLYLDVTVRLGLDWSPGTGEPAVPAPDTTPWWNPGEVLDRLRR